MFLPAKHRLSAEIRMCAEELPLDSVQRGPTLYAALPKTLLWMLPASLSPGRGVPEGALTPLGVPCHLPSDQSVFSEPGIPAQMESRLLQEPLASSLHVYPRRENR